MEKIKNCHSELVLNDIRRSTVRLCSLLRRAGFRFWNKYCGLETQTEKGRGDGGQVVSVLAFYTNDPSSNPSEAHSFSVKFMFEKNDNNQKEAWFGQF